MVNETNANLKVIIFVTYWPTDHCYGNFYM